MAYGSIASCPLQRNLRPRTGRILGIEQRNAFMAGPRLSVRCYLYFGYARSRARR